AALKQLESEEAVTAACEQNFNGYSDCWTAIIFNDIDGFSGVNYTIRADAGLRYINVEKHTSDYEVIVLPVQWALDSAIISLQTNQYPATPQEAPFTGQTNEEQARDIREAYIGGIQALFVLVFFIAFLGVPYHLPGSFMGERASLTTAHMQQMGVLDSARIISWQLSISLAYLPAYILMGIIWKTYVFTHTSTGLLIIVNILTCFSLASWSMLVAAPFGKSPQLAAIASTFLAILLAIMALVVKGGPTLSLIYTLFFPPGFFVFVVLGLCAYEQNSNAPDISSPDPENGNRISALLFIAFIVIFIYPVFAYLVEKTRYNAKVPGEGSFARFKKRVDKPAHPEGAAIAVRNLRKTFPSSKIFGRNRMTAIEDLSFTVPKTGIWILLGANGAGKSTVLSMIANLLGRDSGSITFEGGAAHPPRGSLGIVPQKNVLIPELSCYQTVRLWSSIKRPSGTSETKQDLEQLLIDCDLSSKLHAKSGSLSGGQKRKLQLAIGLVGGSKILLVDEATSGVDPLSRRALWRALTAVKHERTVLFTTHFLDEADLLGDNVTVLAAPGRLLAEGTPVSLKSTLGEGYTIVVTFPATSDPEKDRAFSTAQSLVNKIVPKAEHARVTQVTETNATFALRSKDVHVVREVLEVLQTEQAAGVIAGYEVHGTSLEDIFIRLMGSDTKHSDGHIAEDGEKEGE
ncbi:hypothetical protein FRC15_006111, partial [Serendipita sp. 397]